MRSSSVVIASAICLVLVACGSGSGGENAVVTEASGGVTTTVRSVVTTAPSGSGETTEAAADEPVDPEFFALDAVIRFDPGGTSATISDAVVRGERNRYTLEAAAGQTMVVSLVSVEDNAVFDLYGPGDVLLTTEATTDTFLLPADGVYTLILGGTRGNASYDLTVEIPAS